MTLPAVPKTLGSIRHVFASALEASLGRGQHLNLKTKTHFCVVMVDGLGYKNLKQSVGYSRFLAAAPNLRALNAAYPTTTANNLMSFSSGLQTGQHGFIGHQVLDRGKDVRQNLLTGWGAESPLDWGIPTSVTSRALASGVEVNFVAAAEYQFTGYTRATMHGANFIPADNLAERFEATKKIFRGSKQSITYLYIPELDKQAHRTGWQSEPWSALLEELDGLMRRLITKLPSNSAVLLTADHGMVDSPDSSKIMISDYLADTPMSFVGGDPRSLYLYLETPETAESVMKDLQRQLADTATFVSSQDLLTAGWFGPFQDAFLSRLPDVVAIASRDHTLFHKDFAKPRSIAMVGHHGGVSPAEIKVPLLVWGA